MKFLHKYPQAAFPYSDLVEENRLRGRSEQEFELLDTKVFDGDRYLDVDTLVPQHLVMADGVKHSRDILLFRRRKGRMSPV